ncbi:MAG: AAA family ATPase [Xanthomonadales bacterium]|nr:AAA family ATPase [Xanthomonadales bacterium]
MYLQFFGLNEAPFSITPDPAFVYLSAAHRDALAHLLYGVGQGGSGGFVQLTGEVGTGKTTLCRCLLEQISEETRLALILNPLVTPRELLTTICEELGIETQGAVDSNKALVDRLNAYLLDQHAQGRRVVIVIDEAQNLSPEALEQVRLLTNLETAKDKLLQMVLLGQPELRQLLQRQNLRQLAQRITARYHLSPLNEAETRAYVTHRMHVAGARQHPFTASALRALYQRSSGVPRLINIIADRALAGAYSRELSTVTAKLVHAAAEEVQPSETRVRRSRWPVAVAGVSVFALLTVSILLWGLPGLESEVPPTGAAAGQVTAERPSAAKKGSVAPTETQEGLTRSLAADDGRTGSSNDAPVPLVRLESEWLERQQRQAWQSLAELWRDADDAYAIKAACEGLSGTGYACLRDFGSFARIRQLGLPVLLILRGSEPRHLLLRGFTSRGLLVGSDAQLELQRESVEDRWLGEYLVVWPQAPDWPREIRRGETGRAVDIIMGMAAKAEHAWEGEAVFDSRFESWLMAFQRRHALQADGIIGPNTLIHLMAPTLSEPRLILAADERS